MARGRVRLAFGPIDDDKQMKMRRDTNVENADLSMRRNDRKRTYISEPKRPWGTIDQDAWDRLMQLSDGELHALHFEAMCKIRPL